MLGLDDDGTKWILVYFPVSWLTQFGHGLVTTIVGPTQPYLAENVNVDIDIINLVWTFGFFGFLVGSLATGFIFKRYVQSTTAKMVFLCVNILITGAFMLLLPFTSSFILLVFARLVQNIALGAFVTADASLIIHLLGPIKSRPFTMALHALIGAGFFVATWLVRPFLPDEDEVNKAKLCKWNDDDVTTLMYNNVSTESATAETTLGEDTDEEFIPKIAWPFIIAGAWCIIFSLGFLLLACLPYKMPCYYDKSDDKEDVTKTTTTGIKYSYTFIVLVFLYYFTSCGIERIFQPMATTFGLCTKSLDLTPSAAALTDSCYNGGFMCGRIVSALIAGFVAPRDLILVSLVFCVGAASVLVALADTQVIALYVGCAVLGFFISWQFGACFSWVANKINITGNLSSIFFIGCGAGSLVMPPVVGFAFTSSLGTMSIMYMTLAFCLLQCLLYFTMWMVAKIPDTTPNSYTLNEINH